MSSTRININNSIDHVKRLLELDQSISPALKAAIETVILALNILVEKNYKTSKNSHKPPSTDLGRRPAFPRETKKRSHPGSTIKTCDADEVVLHKCRKCKDCSAKLNEENLVEVTRRQVIDIEIRKKVIEHQSETMFCYCGKLSSAKFPEGINRHVQYSSNIKAKICYLFTAQLLPYNRIALDLKTAAEISLSEASIFNFLYNAYERLEFWELDTKDQLIESDYLHVDETGMKVDKTNHWVHSYSNLNATILKICKNRGGKAPIELDILPHYKGTIIHDCWPTYFKFEVPHALCGAHIIRELNNAFEIPKQSWANSIKILLQKANKKVNESKEHKLKQIEYKKLVFDYRAILRLGKLQTKFPKRIVSKKGQTKEEKAKCLVDRLIKHEESVLRFARESNIPFTNNLAERDLRMSKVKQKISGCFRSILGAHIYCRLRSYMLTQQKQGHDPLNSFKEIFK